MVHKRILLLVIALCMVFCLPFCALGNDRYIDIKLSYDQKDYPPLVNYSAKEYDAFLKDKNYKIIRTVTSKKSEIDFGEFSTTKSKIVILFDIPDDTAVFMDLHNMNTYVEPVARTYIQKGVHEMEIKPGKYTFHVTTSEYPNPLKKEWKFVVLEPIR